MSGYQSEYEKYFGEMRKKHPEWEAEQREGFSLLWNKKVDFSELEMFRRATEKQKPYPYDVNFF